MRTSFEPGFQIVIIGLECGGRMDGAPHNDPNDPGGFTVFGLASKYNIGLSPNTTKEDAKAIYYNKYWVPAGCNDVGFPLDICLFDGAVNPQDDPDLSGVGNKEIMALKPANWFEFLILRMTRYMKCSKSEYVKGHLFRILRLYQAIKSLKAG